MKWVGRVTAVLVLLTAVVVFSIHSYLHAPSNISKEGLAFTVNAGDSIRRVATRLEGLRLLSHPKLWVIYARLSNKTNIRAGEYRLPESASPNELLSLFRSGKVVSYKVTLLEGWTFREALTHLHKQEKISKTLLSLTDNEVLQKLTLNEKHPEGLFFPDTYQYESGDSDRTVLLRAYEKMKKVLAAEWLLRAENLPYKNPYEALIMASIIERESGQAMEREKIAGVFVRRLALKMRLQTDPTVIYGLGKEYQGNLRRRHLKQPSAYNTYLIKGLPPTPIALSGRKSIHGALHPDAGTALYFVAKGDGSHYFSASLEEHNKAVRQYQINQRRDNYRSAP